MNLQTLDWNTVRDWIVFENQLIGYIANRKVAIIDCINK